MGKDPEKLKKYRGYRNAQDDNMLAGLANEDFETASTVALSSRWATQDGKRADRIAERIRTGV